MVAISSSQKKTVFAVALLALISVGVMISGRGGFSGLRSDAFNNPSFVCSEATQTSGKAKYDGASATIQKLSAEKTSLQKKIQLGNADIRKNEAQIKKLENEKKAAEKTERTLEVFIKKNCGPRSVANCAAKKENLKKVQQNIKNTQNSLVTVRAQINKAQPAIQNAESNIKLLEKQIQEIKNFKEDYETCKRALAEKPLGKLIFRSPTMSGEVQFSGIKGSQVMLYDFSMEFPSTPSTISGEVGEKAVTIGSLSLSAVFPLDTISFKDWIIVYPLPGHHDGAVVFSCSYAKNEGTLKCSPRDGQDFVLKRGEAARGLQLYAVLEGITGSGSFKIHGVTGIGHSIPLETEILTTSIKYNYGSTQGQCTDSDNGLNYYTKGQTTLSNGVVSTDFCSSTNTLDEYICPENPSESGVSQTYICPNGCNEGACIEKKSFDVEIEINDANKADLDGKVGNDSQTINSGDPAEFGVKITNTGAKDIEVGRLDIASSKIWPCGGTHTAPTLPFGWKNFGYGGNGNHQDNVLQSGEYMEYTCTDNNTIDGYAMDISVSSNIYDLALSAPVYIKKMDETKVVVNPRNEICEIELGSNKFRLDPCFIEVTMKNKGGDMPYSIDIIPDPLNTGYGFGHGAQIVGFPINTFIPKTGSGGASGKQTIYGYLNDDGLSIGEYNGYMPVSITDYSTYVSKQLRLRAKIQVVENTDPPRTDYCTTTLEGVTYTLEPCSITTEMQDGHGDKPFTFRIVSSENNTFIFSTRIDGWPTYSVGGFSSGGTIGSGTQNLIFRDEYLNTGKHTGYIKILVTELKYGISKELRFPVDLTVN